MKRIGILGGLGPESTISCYAAITRGYHDLAGDLAYPEILIYSVNFAEYIAAGYECAPKVKVAVVRLADAGADFVIAPCNSIHIVYDLVADSLPIPWISIMDVTADAIIARKLRRVGLLGTIFTMGKGFYQAGLERRGLEVLLPDKADQKAVNSIIYDELVINVVRPESRRKALGIMRKLAGRGAEGIVLGCTELPFLIQQKHARIPVFDTTEIQAQRALEMALGGRVRKGNKSAMKKH